MRFFKHAKAAIALSSSVALIATLASLTLAQQSQATTTTQQQTITVDRLHDSNVLVNDMVLDQLPFGKPGEPVRFDPAITNYEATAYYHTTTASVVVKSKAGVHVTVNGKTPDEHSRVSNLPLHAGDNVINVIATKDQQSKKYQITIHKVNTDFRGNVMIPAQVAANHATAAQNAKLIDHNRATSVTFNPAVRTKYWTNNTTGVTITLPKARQVERLTVFGRVIFGPGRVIWWDGGSSVTIQVRPDESSNWQTLATNANMRRDTGGLFYWDFSDYHLAKQIRFWLTPLVKGDVAAHNTFRGVTFEDIEVWGLPDGQTPHYPGPVQNQFTGFNPNNVNWGVDRAQKLALQYGILMPSWSTSAGTARTSLNKRERELSGTLEAPLLAPGADFNAALMKTLGQGTPWGIVPAPFGHIDKHTATQKPRDFLTPAQEKYRNSLVDLQFGDEESWQQVNHAWLTSWLKFAHKQYPGAIAHTNQAAGRGWTYPHLQQYIREASPDLLTYDVYPYSSRYAISDRRNAEARTSKISRPGTPFVLSNIWLDQRRAALEGADGTGNNPILFGQYLDYSFDANVSESQKAITPMLGLASGQKWFGLFRVVYNGADFNSLVDPDGAPTTAFYEFSNLFKDVRGLGKYLTAMTNRFLVVKSGKYDPATSIGGAVPTRPAFRISSDLTNKPTIDALADAGVTTNITATNRGTINAGRPGDVSIGTFRTLPGLVQSKANEIFGKSSITPKGFMVVNSLLGPTKSPEPRLYARDDSGAYWQTAQDITLTLKPPTANATLMMVDPSDYTAKPVPVDGNKSDYRYGTGYVSMTPNKSNGTLALTLHELGGGRGRLFYWVQNTALTPSLDAVATPTPAPTPTPSEPKPATPQPTKPTPATPAPTPGTTTEPTKPVKPAPTLPQPVKHSTVTSPVKSDPAATQTKKLASTGAASTALIAYTIILACAGIAGLIVHRRCRCSKRRS